MTARTWRPGGPGSFQAPPGINAVRDRAGRLWTRSRSRTRWTCGGPHIRWHDLVREHGPIRKET